MITLWPLELVELTAPALWPLDGWYVANDMYVNKGAAANYDDNLVQETMVEQDAGYLVLDNVNFGMMYIMPSSCIN